MRNAECVDVQNYLCDAFGPSSNEAHLNRNMEKLTQFHCLYTRVLTFCIMFLSIKYIVLEIRTNPFTTEYDLSEVLSIVHWQSRSKPLEQFSVGKHWSCET